MGLWKDRAAEKAEVAAEAKEEEGRDWAEWWRLDFVESGMTGPVDLF